MSEQCKEPQAHPARCGCGQAAEADWRNALRTANAHTRQLMAKRDALHAEAEALRAENGRLSDQNAAIADEQARNLDYRALYREQSKEQSKLRTELEAARGLLRDMRHAATINPSCQFGMVNPCRCMFCVETRVNAFLTATPAPEVPDHLRDSSKMVAPEVRAEQGERQEAVAFRCKLSIHKDWKYIDHRAPDSFELRECEIRPLYTTPQPGPDVRTLVEAAQAFADAARPNIYPCPDKPQSLFGKLQALDEQLDAHRQTQRKGEQP